MYIRLPLERNNNQIIINSLRIKANNLADLVNKIQKHTTAKLKYYNLSDKFFICDQAETLKSKILDLEPERSKNEKKEINYLEQVSKSN